MSEIEIIAYICADEGGVVACTEGNSIETLRECSACRVNHSRSPCRVNMDLNRVIFSEVKILSICAQIKDAIKKR